MSGRRTKQRRRAALAGVIDDSPSVTVRDLPCAPGSYVREELGWTGIRVVTVNVDRATPEQVHAATHAPAHGYGRESDS